MGIISIIGFLMFFAILSYMFYRQQKSQLLAKNKKLEETKNTKEYVKVDNIENGVIDLGNHQYRTILACTPQNYNLKSNEERISFRLQVRQFFDSLSREICINIQTKEIKLDTLIESLQATKSIIESRYPENEFIKMYHAQYMQDIKTLPMQFGNTKQKSIYVIVKCDDFDFLDELSEEEKKAEAYKQIHSYTSAIISSLGAANIQARRLTDVACMELIYNALNKNGHSSDIFSKEQDFPKVVTSTTKSPEFSEEEYVDYRLYTIQNELESIIIPRTESIPHMKETCTEIINTLGDMREEVVEEAIRTQIEGGIS